MNRASAPTSPGDVLHEHGHGIQGDVAFDIFAAGTAAQIAASRPASRRVVLAGVGLFMAGAGPASTPLTGIRAGLPFVFMPH